jgi:hypothetical protein
VLGEIKKRHDSFDGVFQHAASGPAIACACSEQPARRRSKACPFSRGERACSGHSFAKISTQADSFAMIFWAGLAWPWIPVPRGPAQLCEASARDFYLQANRAIMDTNAPTLEWHRLAGASSTI